MFLHITEMVWIDIFKGLRLLLRLLTKNELIVGVRLFGIRRTEIKS